MDTIIENTFNDKVILQISKPAIADVSSADYTALKLNKFGTVDNTNGTQMPFIVCHSAAVTLKVQTWKGDIVTWTFTAGPYPMPLKKIFNDAGNTETSIQIGY